MSSTCGGTPINFNTLELRSEWPSDQKIADLVLEGEGRANPVCWRGGEADPDHLGEGRIAHTSGVSTPSLEK